MIRESPLTDNCTAVRTGGMIQLLPDPGYRSPETRQGGAFGLLNFERVPGPRRDVIVAIRRRHVAAPDEPVPTSTTMVWMLVEGTAFNDGTTFVSNPPSNQMWSYLYPSRGNWAPSIAYAVDDRVVMLPFYSGLPDPVVFICLTAHTSDADPFSGAINTPVRGSDYATYWVAPEVPPTASASSFELDVQGLAGLSGAGRLAATAFIDPSTEPGVEPWTNSVSISKVYACLFNYSARMLPLETRFNVQAELWEWGKGTGKGPVSFSKVGTITWGPFACTGTEWNPVTPSTPITRAYVRAGYGAETAWPSVVPSGSNARWDAIQNSADWKQRALKNFTFTTI